MALCIGVGGFAFHSLGGDVRDWPSVWGFALVATASNILVNWATVTTAAHLMTGQPFGRILRNVLFDSPLEYVVSYFAFGLLALVFAFIRESVGL